MRFCIRYSFHFQIHCIDGSATVSGKQTHPRKLRVETQMNREACPTKDLAGKGPPCHNQVVSRDKTQLEGNGWVETMRNETNTSKPKYGGNDYLYSP